MRIWVVVLALAACKAKSEDAADRGGGASPGAGSAVGTSARDGWGSTSGSAKGTLDKHVVAGDPAMAQQETRPPARDAGAGADADEVPASATAAKGDNDGAIDAGTPSTNLAAVDHPEIRGGVRAAPVGPAPRSTLTPGNVAAALVSRDELRYCFRSGDTVTLSFTVTASAEVTDVDDGKAVGGFADCAKKLLVGRFPVPADPRTNKPAAARFSFELSRIPD